MMLRLFADQSGIDAAAAAIRSGGVIAIPTDTLYGIAADPFCEAAVLRVFAVKGRSAERALPLVAQDVGQVERWLGVLSPNARRLADRFWPGPLTILVPAPSALPEAVHGGTGRVGIRVPAHGVTRALCAACETVLTATSANPSGEPATADPDVIERRLGDRIDMLLDAGPTAGGAPSTIVDVTGSQARLVRPGAVEWEIIRTCLHD